MLDDKRVSHSLAHGLFVGRQHEVETLPSALEAALAGRGGLVILVGELTRQPRFQCLRVRLHRHIAEAMETLHSAPGVPSGAARVSLHRGGPGWWRRQSHLVRSAGWDEEHGLAGHEEAVASTTWRLRFGIRDPLDAVRRCAAGCC